MRNVFDIQVQRLVYWDEVYIQANTYVTEKIKVYKHQQHVPLSSKEFFDKSILCNCDELLDKMAVANFCTKSLQKNKDPGYTVILGIFC